jgi:hypothetical protein
MQANCATPVTHDFLLNKAHIKPPLYSYNLSDKKYYNIIEQIKPNFAAIDQWLRKHLNLNGKKDNLLLIEDDYKAHKDSSSLRYNKEKFIDVFHIGEEQGLNPDLIRSFIRKYVHKIIDNKIRFKPERSKKEWWFKEGFTDFLTAQLLLKTKIWNIKTYLDFYNKRIYNYFLYDMHLYQLEKMHGKYLYNEAGHIAGMLYAARLNEVIVNLTGNKDLLNFLVYFFNLFDKDKTLYFSEKLLAKALKNFTGETCASIERLRAMNKLISPILLSGKISAHSKSIIIPKHGSFYKIITNMKINGKEITSITQDQTFSHLYHLKLRNKKGEIEKYTLRPTYKKQIIPQYILTS